MNKNKLLLWKSVLILLLLLSAMLPVQARNCPKFARNYTWELSYRAGFINGENVSDFYEYDSSPAGKISPTEWNFLVNSPAPHCGVCNSPFPDIFYTVITNACGNLSFQLPFPFTIALVDSNGRKTGQTVDKVYQLECRGLMKRNKRINATCSGTFLPIGNINGTLTVTGTLSGLPGSGN